MTNPDQPVDLGSDPLHSVPKLTPVGFAEIRLNFELETEAPPEAAPAGEEQAVVCPTRDGP